MVSRAEVARRGWRALAQSARQRPGGPSTPSLRDVGLLLRGIALWRREERRLAQYRDAGLPILFIVGAPRSGSTLLLQLISRCFDVGYVTNFVSRYWLSPIVGCERQARTVGLDRSAITLESHYGGTTGPSAPHEFGFFWRTWLGLEESDHLTPAELERAAWNTLRGECEGLAGWFGAPLVMKNLNACSYQIERLARELPQARFVHATRDVDQTVASILRTRREVFGDERAWWSVRPADFTALAKLPAREQARTQVEDIRNAVEASLAALPPSRWIEIELADLLAGPDQTLVRLEPLLGLTYDSSRLPRAELRKDR